MGEGDLARCNGEVPNADGEVLDAVAGFLRSLRVRSRGGWPRAADEEEGRIFPWEADILSVCVLIASEVD